MSEHRGTLPPGYHLEEYRIESVLGQGGFGVTYLAVDIRLEQPVAIKEYLPRDCAVREADSTVMPRSTSDEPAFFRGLERFLTEAQTLAKLGHPSIVRVRRYFPLLNTAFMVMDYEEGQSLKDIIDGMHAPREEAWVHGLLAPLLDALEMVHAKKFLHFDIKPANIYVRSNGSPVLLDFGAARSVQAIESGLSAMLYTPGYAPFEQYAADGKQGPWTDIYGLAGVLYQLVTLKRPIDAPNRVGGKEMLPAATLAKGRYDARLLGAIDWGLRVDAEARPQSIGEWRRGRGNESGLDFVRDAQRHDAERRDAYQRDDFSATTVVRPVQPDAGDRGTDGGVRRRRATVAAAALVVMAGLATAAILRRSTEAPTNTDGAPAPTGLPTLTTPPTLTALPAPSTAAIPARSDLTLNDSDSVIGALGMVDAGDDRYKANPERLLVDLRADARRQVIEKAVGIFVERDALLSQYQSLEEVFSHGELIERLADDARPRAGKDGLVYLSATADVRLQDLRKAVFRLSREQRVALIRAQGDPLVSVAVAVRDAERGSPIERSALAENVIKERIRDFGFRVASPARRGDENERDRAVPPADFAIESEAKLKRLSHKLAASGITIEKYVLTSWTVKCTERASGEDIYFDNRLPDSGSWADEDRALQQIGELIADAFSRDLFAQHLPRASRRSRLAIDAVPSVQAANLLRLELLGLRSVVQVAMAEPAGDKTRFALSWYDQGPGGEQSFDGTVLAPLRRKLGADCLVVESDLGADEVEVRLAPECAQNLLARLETLPASALSDAPAERLAVIARSLATMRQFFLLNPEGVRTLAARGMPLAREALQPDPAGKVDL